MLALTALLPGCADLALTQDREEMFVRVGPERVSAPAAPSSGLLLDYALLSDQTYANSLYPNPKSADPRHPDAKTGKLPFDIGDDTYCDERFSPPGKCQDTLGLTALARARLSRWQLVYASLDPKEFRCLPVARANCARPLEGLGVQVWMRRGRVCPEAVIAFRGTDGQSADDWASNLRWFLRALPFYDQYDQVQDYAPAFVRTVERQPCYVRGRTRITAIGHSLGGGLAHQAAYREGAIRAVVSFDPSVVTGYHDLPPTLRDANTAGLSIERVYEFGEVLAYPRTVLRQFSPESVCDPRIRTVRLHTIEGSAIQRHSLSAVATALLGWSKAQADKGESADRSLPLERPARCRDGQAKVP